MTEGIIGFEHRPVEWSKARGIDRWARAVIHTRMQRIAHGEITVVDGGEVQRYGRPDAGPRVEVSVLDPRFYRWLALRGALGSAEAYMEGFWRCDDLTGLIRIMALDHRILEGFDGAARWLFRPPLQLYHALRRNTLGGSRRNISAHYDLGNDFFELFLDPTLTYSSGIFEDADASLEQASVAKYERICRKLRLGPQDDVLEIGSGWGGFAIHAARTRGCRVTTTTISRQQFDLAQERIAEAGVADRVELLFEDYREITGSWDKLVSIEMIEAVGHRNLGTFFRTCSDRLRPDGAMLLQAITVRDQDYEDSKRNVDFIKRHVFPGGQLVSVGAICEALTRGADLRITHLEDITPHYAETLARWRDRMAENLERMRALGLDERFLAMWEFYLCYCEGGFRERVIGALQMLLEKPMSRREPVLGAV